MLIVALVLAVVSLAALVTAVVTSNELIAWVCIGFSALGVLLLIVDAVRDRNRRASGMLADDDYDDDEAEADYDDEEADYDDEAEADFDDDEADDEADAVYDDEADEANEADYETEVIDYPVDEVVYDDPEHDLPSDDEPEYPVAAEEAAVHVVTEPSDTVNETAAVIYAAESAGDSAVVLYPDDDDDDADRTGAPES